MIEVIPAIIPKTFDELCHKLSLVSGVISTVQIDILDGKFTSYKTWPNILNPDPNFVKIIREEEAFPHSEDLEFEVHLMVSDPVSFFQPWVSAGAKRVIVHVESFENTEKAKQCIESFYNQYGGDGSFLGVEFTLAIKIDTPLSSVAELIPLVDSVQCMGIAEIGVQGQPFDDRALSLIENIHQEYPEKIISVDGGINVNTAKRVVGVGATRLVVGSALFESADMLGTIETLENLV